MREVLVLAVLLVASTAAATPTTVTQQGRLLDAAGTPVNGQHTLAFGLWSASAAGTEVWTETQTVTLSDGYYAVVLGNVTPLDATVLSADGRWLSVAVDGAAAMPTRTQVHSVPFATVAGAVRGGAVDASSVSVGGTEVISPTGVVRGTVDELSCADGDVASWDATTGSWSCNGVVPTRGAGMYTYAIGGSTTLTTAFSHDLYTCGGSQVVHVEAAITHWTAAYRTAVDKFFYMDSYTTLSTDVLLDTTSAAGGSWSFQRIVTGNNGSGDTSDRLRITHNAGTYNGGANYYIFVRSTCPIRELP